MEVYRKTRLILSPAAPNPQILEFLKQSVDYLETTSENSTECHQVGPVIRKICLNENVVSFHSNLWEHLARSLIDSHKMTYRIKFGTINNPT